MLSPQRFSLTPVPVQRKLLATLRSQWHDSILQALQKSKHNMSKLKTVSKYNVLYPYLCLLPEEEYVGIMLQVGPCPALAEPQGAWMAKGLLQSTVVLFGPAESGHKPAQVVRYTLCSLC